MNLKQEAQELHAGFAGVIAATAQGFHITTDAGELTFTDTTGEGAEWRDGSGVFALTRRIERASTGLVIRCTLTNRSRQAAPPVSAQPLFLEFAVGRQD